MDSSNNHRSRYGIQPLREGTYNVWSFQCWMLLEEKKAWDLVQGTLLRPQSVDEHSPEEWAALTAAAKTKVEKAVTDWDELNQEALRIISFTVAHTLQGPIISSQTAKEAWDHLQGLHAPRDKQRKFSLLRRLYRLDMTPDLTLLQHESTFDALIHELATMGKMIEDEDLIVIYAGSLPNEHFGNWVQTQMSQIDGVTLLEFQGHVREEAR